MRYNKIRKMDISDGIGIRVSLFVQGCEFHCKGCFNPETWNFEGGNEFTTDTLNTLMDLCNQKHIRGLSILGGEPLNDKNFETVLDICKIYKEKFQKDLWIWTGYEYEDIANHQKKKEVLNYLDYMVCGQFILEQRNLNLKWAGSENQRWINVQESLKQNKVVLAGNMLEK